MTTDIADLPMPALEDEITTLAGHLAASTCRYLQLICAFDLGGGWHGVGVRSCAQWLSWRCGLSSNTAREQLRVAHALRELPVVRAAFAGGRLSYSKARALTRVASPEDEQALVETATACTASQLDRLCSGIARARSSLEVLEQAGRASFSARWEPDGGLRFSGRLSAEDGAVLLAALAAVRPEPVTDPPADPTCAATGDGVISVHRPDVAREAAHSDAAALVLLARHALAEPPAEMGAVPVRLVVHATAAALEGAGPGPGTPAPGPSDAAVRLDDRPPADRAADGRRAVDEAAGKHGADEPAVDGRRADVRDADDDRPASAEAPADDRPASAEAPAVGVLDAGPGIPLLPLGPDTLRRLVCEALVEPARHPDSTPSPRAAGDPGLAGRAGHRFASPRQRRALLVRDGGCAFPGCVRRRALHAHHLLPWHLGGPTTMDNLVLTCPHHHLLVHEGGWRLRPGAGGRWEAVGPDGRVCAAAPPMAGDVHRLASTHDADIEPTTVTGHWGGEPLDLAYAVGGFVA